MSASIRSSNCWSSRIALHRRRLAARPRASWVLRKTRMRSHSANARTVPRTQDWMTRLRLMRACRSISKDKNSGTELSFLDIVISCAAGRPESARTTVGGSGVEAARRGGSTSRQHVTGVPSSRRDARLEAHLQPVLNVFGDFLEIFPKWYGATVPIAADYLTRRRTAANHEPAPQQAKNSQRAYVLLPR